MTPEETQEAIREPREGDEWHVGGHDRIITGVTPTKVSFRLSTGGGGWVKGKSFARLFAECTLIRRGPAPERKP